jgi:hypothetical protein
MNRNPANYQNALKRLESLRSSSRNGGSGIVSTKNAKPREVKVDQLRHDVSP